MIISEQQARAAAEHLRAQPCTRPVCRAATVSSDILERAREAAAAAPDFRADRVAEARERMDLHPVCAREIAEKMIFRIVSDSVR